MKNLAYLLLVAAALTFKMTPSNAVAQHFPDENGPSRLSPAQLPAGVDPVFRVTYFKSQTGIAALRSASIVSITNQSTTPDGSCMVAVDWKAGGGGVVCGTSLTIAPGVQVDFCTRPIPGGITACNSTCPRGGLTANEGNATVGASITDGGYNCQIAVSARTVYTASTTDSPISAITDAKVVDVGNQNFGD